MIKSKILSLLPPDSGGSSDPSSEIFGKINAPKGVPSGPDAISRFMTAGLKLFFVGAGLAAFLFLLLGAFDWITSGGDKEKVMKAQRKLQYAVAGLILLFIILAGVATLEQVVFNKKLCLGLTCAIEIPQITP